MRQVTVTRWPSADDGTFGDFVSDSGFNCAFGELPDRQNHAGISCIPVGTYQAEWAFSPAHKMFLYHLLDVPNRSVIEIHSGNVCGDVSMGFQSDVKGCGLLGQDVTLFKSGTRLTPSHLPMTRDQRGVSSSGYTLSLFHKDLRDSEGVQLPFSITIK